MILPPVARTLIHQLVQALGLQAHRPESLTVHFDRDGEPQAVKPVLNFRHQQADVDKRA